MTTKTTKKKKSKPIKRKVTRRKRSETNTVSVTCKKCGETFKLDIGNKTRKEVENSLAKQQTFECPGHHVELSSPLNYWVIDWNSIKPQYIPTDEEWLEQMKKDGYKLISNDELRRDYDVTGFSMGLCVAIRKSDKEKVVLDFTNSPSGKRYYY